MRRGLLFGCLVAVLATLGQATLHNGVKTQPPFYPHYPTRTVWLLDGTWDFGTKDNVADVINFAAEAGVWCCHLFCHLSIPSHPHRWPTHPFLSAGRRVQHHRQCAVVL